MVDTRSCFRYFQQSSQYGYSWLLQHGVMQTASKRFTYVCNRTYNDRVRLFSRRARRYMVTYYKLAHGLVEWIDLKDGGGALSTVKIESVVKACKTHRCAMDFDAKFIAEFSP